MQIDEGELFSFAWFVVHYTLVLIMLVVNFFADAEPHSAAGITKPDVSRFRLGLCGISF